METTQKPMQEQSAQLILSQTAESAKPLYNPAEAAQIVKHLTDGFFDPEYILLFGKLAGGTPHSDTAAYDLLVVVRQSPEYDWQQTGQLLRYKMPVRLREVAYINLYIMRLRDVESNKTPFLHFALSEGEVLYCRENYHFLRPKRSVDFAAAYADAAHHFETFRTLGEDLLARAHRASGTECNLRLAAFFTAQAAVCFYHTLYYVYHGREFENLDPLVLHERLRTLSPKLMLTLDNTHTERIFTLSYLKKFLDRVLCDTDFDLKAEELASHLQRVEKLGGIVAECCRSRLELYRQLGAR